jgi:hypothetical protein
MEDPTKLFTLLLYTIQHELAALIVRELDPNVYGGLGIVHFKIGFSSRTKLREVKQTSIILV